MLTLYVKRVVEPANQELASTATPEPIHNNTDIIEIDESTTYLVDVMTRDDIVQPVVPCRRHDERWYRPTCPTL